MRMKAFNSWLLQQKERDDIVGDFARDAAADLWFSADVRTIMQVKLYLLNLGVSSVTLDAFADSVFEYIRMD
jgi:hypothetical protein